MVNMAQCKSFGKVPPEGGARQVVLITQSQKNNCSAGQIQRQWTGEKKQGHDLVLGAQNVRNLLKTEA